ncbi:hypothetical protein ANCCAN_29456 [Ancylostoma caninum]|uniref:Uncharacterized protein n=1 Tax=Ancylostoma caninum TaxID=29170 RepID=A0A368F1G1_ANCCA|nr:hypothetical protein ANCCAN_29456 [Ancylostoma caninum]
MQPKSKSSTESFLVVMLAPRSLSRNKSVSIIQSAHCSRRRGSSAVAWYSRSPLRGRFAQRHAATVVKSCRGNKRKVHFY